MDKKEPLWGFFFIMLLLYYGLIFYFGSLQRTHEF